MIHKDLNKLEKIIKKHKEEWKKIVRTNWCFDILHPGHVETFKQGKKLGDILIIWVNSDMSPYRKEKPWRPVNNESFRSEMLKAIKFIDYIFLYNEETPLIAISQILPDILLKWWDYKIEEIIWHKKVLNNWGRVVTVPIVKWYSTTNIINKIQK